jgi:signal transduction histidine kinase
MVPYRGRQALGVARLGLALAGGGWYGISAGLDADWITALLIAYALYAAGSLLDLSYDSPLRAAIAQMADTAYFALWAWLAPDGWQARIACAYLMTSTVLLHDVLRASVTAGVALFLALILAGAASATLPASVVALAGVAVGLGVYRNYLDRRMSATLRQNVVIRSQAQNAREAERQRIAADFHDGPLQSFISFQMRLEIIRKLLKRDAEAAASELRQLQDLCRGQVTDLRSFVRSMRPADEGMSLAASVSRMAESFQRETGITTTFTAGELHDPPETEVSLELLQILREALNNIQKHSGATRVAMGASRSDRGIDVVIEDNGGGFPFSGSFTLEELELLHLGPASIKRRVRMLEGDLTLDSRPGEGAKLAMRIPL